MAYEINININGDVEEGQAQIKGMSNTPSSSSSSAEKGQKALGKYVASHTIEPFIQNVKTAISQDVGLITGNTELQDRINFGFQAVQYGVNTYKNVQAGISLGTSMGMTAGTAASIAIALTAISTMVDFAFKEYQKSIKMDLENYQLQQTRSRLGSAFNKSRRGG